MERHVGLVALMLLFSGCVGSGLDESAIGPGPSVSAVATETTGAIQGLVTDMDVNPIANVLVGIDLAGVSASTNTSADGTFAFASLQAGAYRVFAQKLGYQSAATKANVTTGRVTPVHINLTVADVAPDFPLTLRVDEIKTQGGWFQVPYAQAQSRLPAGFRAKPHVLADPNDQTAEYAVYVTSYKNGTLGDEPIGEGFWAFEVLNVDAPSPHASGATAEFVLVASYASDPAVQALLARWNLPTSVTTITLTPGEAGASTFRGVSSVKNEKGTYQLNTANSQGQETLTGGALSVRIFGIQEQAVVNYVDITIDAVQYSLTGAAQVEGASALTLAPSAPVGEAYMQWGPAAVQTMSFLSAKNG